MHRPFRSLLGWQTAALLAGALLLSSCASPRSAPASPGAGLQVPPPASQSTFTVTRGSITDIIQSSGRVVAQHQQALYFRQAGHINTISAHLNDKVKAGQVLAALDTSALQTQIQQAQAAVDTATLTLEKDKELQATQGSSSSTTGKAITPQDVASADAAVKSAQAVYDATQANLATIETPKAQDVEQAQAAVVQAQSALSKAQLRLQAITAGPSASDMRQAQAGVSSAKAKLDAAQQQLKVVQAGPTAVQLAQARAALEQAQAHFQTALAAYDAFQNGPSLAQRQQATLAVTQAKNALYAAQSKRDSVCHNASTKTASPADCNAANASVDTAQANLDAAQKTLSQLADVSPTDRLAAESAYKQAEDKLTAAQQSYQEMLQGALPSAAGGSASGGHISHATQVAQAQGAVQQAQAGVIAAQAAVTALTPTANAVAQGRQAVVSEQAALQSAQAQLNALLQPSATAVRQAKDQVSAAAAAVTAAQARAQQLRELVGQTDTGALDLAIDRNAVQQAQLAVQALQAQLSQMQIVAPFDGAVIASSGQAGDQIGAYSPVLTIADPTTLQVAVDLSPGQLARVAIGQTVNLTLREFPGQNISGAITGLPSSVLAASNQDQNSPGAAAATPAAGASSAASVVDPAAVTITPKWPSGGASLGEAARISISAETKNDVLLVPTQAINKANNRIFVLVSQNGHELPVDIQIGIQNTDMTEVLSGLQAGQKV
ncbi:MAG TPA: HlyD family efflux transporter periplasmic adaptor subunit, partial [Chloroflexota bacterium]|nr:HlyD family efflux transporter periplasmic adaptor subunit [Chloroflexota bacterium]